MGPGCRYLRWGRPSGRPCHALWSPWRRGSLLVLPPAVLVLPPVVSRGVGVTSCGRVPLISGQWGRSDALLQTLTGRCYRLLPAWRYRGDVHSRNSCSSLWTNWLCVRVIDLPRQRPVAIGFTMQISVTIVIPRGRDRIAF